MHTYSIALPRTVPAGSSTEPEISGSAAGGGLEISSSCYIDRPGALARESKQAIETTGTASCWEAARPCMIQDTASYTDNTRGCWPTINRTYGDHNLLPF